MTDPTTTNEQNRTLAGGAQMPTLGLGVWQVPDGPVCEQAVRAALEVLLRWCVQRATVVIPKSTHRERIGENAQIFAFSLTEEQIATLDGLDQTGATDSARESKWW